MEEEFLAKNNPCGQTLLNLASRGNAIIAELLRLKDQIPRIFRLENKSDHQKYGEIIMDFSYFSTPELIEQKIEQNDALLEIDRHIQDMHGDVLGQFYRAYEGVHKYICDLNLFVEEVEDGIFIQQSLDTIFLSEDGIQLMCESVYLYGVMLLILELYHCAPIRERLIVAYSRYNITVETLDHVCQLLCSTGFVNSPSLKRPLNYPQDYFARVKVNEKLLNMVVGKLRTEDIYHQQKALPLPQHSTTAFAQQAAMLFVVLFFTPNILHNQTARMREIVDKFFPDNWIVSVYMGITVNLIELWEPFKAARIALANTLDSSNIKEYASVHAEQINKLLKETNDLLKEGILVKKTIIENTPKLLCLVRECNVSLRWLLLHTVPRHSVCDTMRKTKQVRDQVLSDTNHQLDKILDLLLNTAEVEIRIIDLFKEILNEREEKWVEGKEETVMRIKELADVFAGTKQLMRVNKNESLKIWFGEIAGQVETLSLEEPNISARKIAQLIKALEEVQGFQQMTGNLQMKQLAMESVDILKGMLGAVNVRDTLLVQMQIIGDFSYGWVLVDSYTDLIQSGIKKDPLLVHKLRSVFLKLSSAMETPLLRINQAENSDLSSVSSYYSNQLVSYAKRVLHIIPETVFTIMAKIADIQTKKIPELPVRLEKDKLKEYAQLDYRFEVARLTNEVSVFSTGLLKMKSTLVGIVRVDPRQLLEDGIRKELAMHILRTLDNGLTFNPKSKGSDLTSKLEALGNAMEGQKNSFEYIQDYIGINGIKMWQEELKRIINESVEAECLCLQMKSGTLDLQNSTFIGRLTREIIIMTDPKAVSYLETESAWVDLKAKVNVLDIKYFERVLKAVGVPGLVGVDKLLGFVIVKHLQSLVGFFQKESQNNKSWLECFASIAKSLTPTERTIEQPAKVYPNAAAKLYKLLSSGMLETVMSLGQLQLLRKHVAYTLNHTAKTNARTYTSALSNLNEAMLHSIKLHERDPSKYNCPSSEDLGKVATLLDWVGLTDPYSKIYITTRSIPYIPLLIFIFATAHVPGYLHDKNRDAVLSKKTGETIVPFVVGLHTLLKQFHSTVVEQFIAYCCQYSKSYMLSSALLGKQEIPSEALSMIQFLEEFIECAGLPREMILKHIPNIIFDLFKFGLAAYAEC